MGNEIEYNFYSVNVPELSNEEKLDYILLKKLQTLKTIKNCVMFFTVLTVISLIFSLFISLKF